MSTRLTFSRLSLVPVVAVCLGTPLSASAQQAAPSTQQPVPPAPQPPPTPPPNPEQAARDQAAKDKAEKDKAEKEQAEKDQESTPITSTITLALGYDVTRYSPAKDPTVAGWTEAVAVGWSVALAARPLTYFEVVSELSGTQGSNVPGSADEHQDSILFLNGPRAVIPAKKHITVLGDWLLGIAHRDLPASSSADSDRFVSRFGGGVDVHVSDYVSARFHVGWTFNLDSSYGSVIQFTTAIVFGRHSSD